METFAHFLVLMAAPLTTAIVMSFHAKKLNAQWRERRAAKLAARA